MEGLYKKMMIIVIGIFSCFISANLCRGDRRGVWFRALV